MQQITVPQFLDVEDKIIGPITVRQFLEILFASIIIFIFYKIFDFSLFLASGITVAVITITFAFVKINGQPFHNFVLNFVATLKSPKLKIWKKSNKLEKTAPLAGSPDDKKEVAFKVKRQAISSSSLSELALIVDTGGVYRGEGIADLVSEKKKIIQ